MKSSIIQQKLTCKECYRRTVKKTVKITDIGITVIIEKCTECGNQSNPEDYARK